MAGNHNSGRKPNAKRLRRANTGSQRRRKLRAPDGLAPEVRKIFDELARLFADVVNEQDTHILASWAGALWVEYNALKALAEDGILRPDNAHAGRLAKNPAFTIWKAASERSAALAPRFGGDPAARVRLLDLLAGDEPLPDLRDLLSGDD